MADIVGNLSAVNDIETAVDAPVTEALIQKIGANINGLIDANTAMDTRVTALEDASDGAAFNTGAGSYTAAASHDVMSLTVTLGANDSVIFLLGYGTGAIATSWPKTSGTAFTWTKVTNNSFMRWRRDSTDIVTELLTATQTFAPLMTVDKPGAGTYTYKFQFAANGGTSSATYAGSGCMIVVRG
jgi:hypothetical protein